MAESKLHRISMDFAVQVIKVCENIQGHASLTGRLERAATNIGINIYGAIHTRKNADLTAKLQVALMGCQETGYCLELLHRAEILDKETVDRLAEQCCEISSILIRILKIFQENTE